MHSPQIVEMLSPLLHAERLANSERNRLAYARIDNAPVTVASRPDVFHGRLAQLLIMFRFAKQGA